MFVSPKENWIRALLLDPWAAFMCGLLVGKTPSEMWKSRKVVAPNNLKKFLLSLTMFSPLKLEQIHY